MNKRAVIEEESKGKDQTNRKSWPDLGEEEESKDGTGKMVI